MENNEIKCPKCNETNPADSVECSNCGIFYKKYLKSRERDFKEQLRSFHNSSLKDIQSKMVDMVKKHPGLKSQCVKFFNANKAVSATLKAKKYSTAIDLLEKIKKVYPDYAVEADRKIEKIEETKNFTEIFSKGIKAYKEERYADAKYILQKLQTKYPDHKGLEQYLEKLSNYIEIDDPDSEQAEANLPSCPKCDSTSIITLKKGYDSGSGCCGAILLGPLGLLCGAMESNQIHNVCQNCGHKWLISK
jgi:tellurium resistance protein TerD